MMEKIATRIGFLKGFVDWCDQLLAPIEITKARPCEDVSHAKFQEAHAIFYVQDDRYDSYGRPRRKNNRVVDWDGIPQRMYWFRVNKPELLMNPDKETIEIIAAFFTDLDIPIDSMVVLQKGGVMKYIPFLRT